MEPLLRPTNDVAFKYVFGSQDDKAPLISLLNAVLQPTVKIADVEILNPGLPLESIDDKGAILDILVRLKDGTQVNVEMQCRSYAGFRERVVFYWAKLITSQLHRGDPHAQLKPTIVIVLLNDREFDDSPQLHSHFEIREVSRQKRFADLLHLHVVELPKLEETEAAGLPVHPALANWVRYLRTDNADERKRLCMTDPGIKAAQRRLEDASNDPEIRRLAEARELARATMWIVETESIKKGKAEGEAKGKAEAVLKLLRRMGIELAPEDTARIRACRDLAQLDAWFDQAFTVKSAAELFG